MLSVERIEHRNKRTRSRKFCRVNFWYGMIFSRYFVIRSQLGIPSNRFFSSTWTFSIWKKKSVCCFMKSLNSDLVKVLSFSFTASFSRSPFILKHFKNYIFVNKTDDSLLTCLRSGQSQKYHQRYHQSSEKQHRMGWIDLQPNHTNQSSCILE